MDFAISLFVFFTLIAYVLCSKVKESNGYFTAKAEEIELKRVNLLINGDKEFNYLKKHMNTIVENGWCSDWEAHFIMAKEGYAFPKYFINTGRPEVTKRNMNKILELLRESHPELIIDIEGGISSIGASIYTVKAERREPEKVQKNGQGK